MSAEPACHRIQRAQRFPGGRILNYPVAFGSTSPTKLALQEQTIPYRTQPAIKRPLLQTDRRLFELPFSALESYLSLGNQCRFPVNEHAQTKVKPPIARKTDVNVSLPACRQRPVSKMGCGGRSRLAD